jgi:hypothetical protein
VVRIVQRIDGDADSGTTHAGPAAGKLTGFILVGARAALVDAARSRRRDILRAGNRDHLARHLCFFRLACRKAFVVRNASIATVSGSGTAIARGAGRASLEKGSARNWPLVRAERSHRSVSILNRRLGIRTTSAKDEHHPAEQHERMEVAGCRKHRRRLARAYPYARA